MLDAWRCDLRGNSKTKFDCGLARTLRKIVAGVTVIFVRKYKSSQSLYRRFEAASVVQCVQNPGTVRPESSQRLLVVAKFARLSFPNNLAVRRGLSQMPFGYKHPVNVWN